MQMNVDNLRLTKDMKYEALYLALGFEETIKGLFIKKYNQLIVTIDVNNQCVDFENKLTIVNGDCLELKTHKSFVILECIDKLLTMGYLITEIIFDLDNEYDLYLNGLYIKCFEWNHEEEDNIVPKKDTFMSVTYSSRLVSGIIERKTSIKIGDGEKYDIGIFENERKQEHYYLSKSECILTQDFIIKNDKVIKYIGNSENIIVPDGVKELASCLFWDNQFIRKINLPNSLVSIGGDTFYNASNLEEVNIPANVKYMGNNPFAGCKKVKINNESPYFNYVDGALYNKDFTRLIYYSILSENKKYVINQRCKVIGKHAFYMCNNLNEIEVPSSIVKIENNPFSGCEKLNIKNYSKYYHIEDCVIYDQDYSSVIGCLNSIDTDCLQLKNVKRICRNAFWNCKGIRKIILPQTLENIGYNPFVSCSNIEFVSYSDKYIVYKNALYTCDKFKLVCYPSKYAVGEICLPDETQVLERGAFSGCDKMTNINLHNISIISKSSFGEQSNKRHIVSIFS